MQNSRSDAVFGTGLDDVPGRSAQRTRASSIVLFALRMNENHMVAHTMGAGAHGLLLQCGDGRFLGLPATSGYGVRCRLRQHEIVAGRPPGMVWSVLVATCNIGVCEAAASSQPIFGLKP